MWRVLGLMCIFLLPRITLGICGVPAKPSHGQLWPDKPFYDNDDKVRVMCEEKYLLFGKETDMQTCYSSVWTGQPSVCLRNLASGRNLTHFGSPSGGKRRPHGGTFIYDVANPREDFFFDLHLERSTRHAFVYFHGNFTVTDQDGNELPFDQTVLAFNSDIQFYQPCPEAESGGYFDCISTNEQVFKGAKVEISLLNKSVDMSNSFLQVKLQLEDNGFVVLDVADKDCGTPPIPFRGSVSMATNGNNFEYSCEPGYSLRGKSEQTCDVTQYPTIRWLSEPPFCLASPLTTPPTGLESITVIAVVVTVGFIVVILVVVGIVWFNKKTKLQEQNLQANFSRIELNSGDVVGRCDLNKPTVPSRVLATNTNRMSDRPLPLPSAVTNTPVIENSHSRYTTPPHMLENDYIDVNVNDTYEYIDVANIKGPTSQ